eukprot:192546-Rhodomonas_salina.1
MSGGGGDKGSRTSVVSESVEQEVEEEPPLNVDPLNMIAVKKMVDTMSFVHREQVKDAAETWRHIQIAKLMLCTMCSQSARGH